METKLMIKFGREEDTIVAPRKCGEVVKVAIQDVEVKDRFRKDMGDLQTLMESIKQHGLLQPIGITEDNILVFGQRRLTACYALNWVEIDARVVDLHSIVEGEFAENEMRKQFTPSERLAIAEAVQREIGKRQGGDRKTIDFQSARLGTLKGKTRDISAKKAGFSSHQQMERTAKVVDLGAPQLVEKMDKGEIAVSKAADLANLTPQEQVVSLQGEKAARETREEAERALLEEIRRYELYHPANAYTDYVKKHRKRPDRQTAADLGKLLGGQVKADDGTLQPPKSKTQKESEREAKIARKEETALRAQCGSVTMAFGYLAHCKDDPAVIANLVDRWQEPTISENFENAVIWFNKFAQEWRRHAAERNTK